MGDVLIVDDEKDIRELISDILEDEGYVPRTASDSSTALDAVEERLPSCVILDIWLQGSALDGLGILEILQKKHPDMPVIMISGHGNIETAINTIRMGAYDYIEKPFKEDRLLHLVHRAVEAAKLKGENKELKKSGSPETHLIGNSLYVTQMRTMVERVATTSSRVLISGPAGSGKEVIARAIHQHSHRARGPFIVMNAANITNNNVEEQLFGVEGRGPLTIEGRQIGTFERAHGGTLFIDEVTDMPLSTQGKLVRFLQESAFERVGGNRTIQVDVRVIAATTKDMQKEIEQGRFREDLFYRLNVVPITVPALKERREDIVDLAQYFLTRSAELLGLKPRKLSKDALIALEAYSWPGNVRQLRNVIEWLLIMAKNNASDIVADDMPPEVLNDNEVVAHPEANADIMSMPLKLARELFEKQYLSAQISRFSGNISKTASFVGMERSALHRKLKLLNLDREDGE